MAEYRNSIKIFFECRYNIELILIFSTRYMETLKIKINTVYIKILKIHQKYIEFFNLYYLIAKEKLVNLRLHSHLKSVIF